MLFIVNKRNPYFRNGAMLRRFDDGWEQVRMERIPGTSRHRQVGYKGLVIPLNVIDMTKYALPIQSSQAPDPEYMHRQKRIIVS